MKLYYILFQNICILYCASTLVNMLFTYRNLKLKRLFSYQYSMALYIDIIWYLYDRIENNKEVGHYYYYICTRDKSESRETLNKVKLTL